MALDLKDYLKDQIERGDIEEDDKGVLWGKSPDGEPRMYFRNYLDQIGYATMEGGELHSVFIYGPRQNLRRLLDGVD